MKQVQKLWHYHYYTALRIMVLCRSHPKVFIIFMAVSIAAFLPFVRIETSRSKVSKQRKSRKKNKRNWGWAIGKSYFTINVFGRGVACVSIRDEYQLNLITFFINRNIKLLRKAIQCFEAQGKPILFYPGMKIFEPGCNAGRNLFFFRDYYEANVWGADVYATGIAIARKANIFKDAHLFEADLVKSDFLSNFCDNAFDLTIIRSHIVHVVHFDRKEREAYYQNLVRISRHLMVIEKKTKQVKKFLERYGFNIIIDGDLIYGSR